MVSIVQLVFCYSFTPLYLVYKEQSWLMKYTEIHSHTSDFLLCILLLCMLSNHSLQKFGIVEEFQQTPSYLFDTKFEFTLHRGEQNVAGADPTNRRRRLRIDTTPAPTEWAKASVWRAKPVPMPVWCGHRIKESFTNLHRTKPIPIYQFSPSFNRASFHRFWF